MILASTVVFYFEPGRELDENLRNVVSLVAKRNSLYIKERATDYDQIVQQIVKATTSRWSMWFGPSFQSGVLLLSFVFDRYEIAVSEPMTQDRKVDLFTELTRALNEQEGSMHVEKDSRR